MRTVAGSSCVLAGNATWRPSGHYNWSSPGAHTGYAYVGIASHRDTPLVQGKLLRVSLSTSDRERVESRTRWAGRRDNLTSPVLDAAQHGLRRTGNHASDYQGEQPAVLAVAGGRRRNHVRIKGHWQRRRRPTSRQMPISPLSPTPFTGCSGRDLVSAAHKNGKVYALYGAACPPDRFCPGRWPPPAAGDEPVEEGVLERFFWTASASYYAGGRTTIEGGRPVEGSIRAFNPATGATVWERALLHEDLRCPLARTAWSSCKLGRPTAAGWGDRRRSIGQRLGHHLEARHGGERPPVHR